MMPYKGKLKKTYYRDKGEMKWLTRKLYSIKFLTLVKVRRGVVII